MKLNHKKEKKKEKKKEESHAMVWSNAELVKIKKNQM